MLLIDHLWVHYGGPIIEKIRGEYREEIKKAVKEGNEVEVQQAYRKSIIDNTVEKVKEWLKRGEEKKEE